MARTYTLDVVTPEKAAVHADVTMIILRGSEGDLGVLAQHMPLVTRVLPCSVEIRDASNQPSFMAVSGGFLEVRRERVTLLARSAERPEDIDVGRAEAAKQRAQQRLGGSDADLDKRRAEEALARANARLAAAERRSGQAS